MSRASVRAQRRRASVALFAPVDAARECLFILCQRPSRRSSACFRGHCIHERRATPTHDFVVGVIGVGVNLCPNKRLAVVLILHRHHPRRRLERPFQPRSHIPTPSNVLVIGSSSSSLRRRRSRRRRRQPFHRFQIQKRSRRVIILCPPRVVHHRSFVEFSVKLSMRKFFRIPSSLDPVSHRVASPSVAVRRPSSSVVRKRFQAVAKVRCFSLFTHMYKFEFEFESTGYMRKQYRFVSALSFAFPGKFLVSTSPCAILEF